MSLKTNYSELQTKEDSLEQILRLSGLPDKFKLRAFEFNMVRAKINHLKFLLDNLELSGGEGIAGLDIVLFRFFIGGFEPESYATYINDLDSFEVTPGQIPKFRFLIYLPNQLPKITSFSIRGEQQGIFGEGGSRLLTEDDLFVDFERNATADELEEESETQIVTFPNISGDIQDWLNSKDPVITLQPSADGIVIFRGNLFAEDQSYLFIGPRGDYGVGAENTALAEHFEPLRESSNSNTITVDSAFSTTSLNPLQNKVLSLWANGIEAEIKELVDNIPVDGLSAFEVWLADGNEVLKLEDYYEFISGQDAIAYISKWNPTTNVPSLTDGNESKARTAYRCTNNFTRFSIDWKIGDYLLYDDNGDIFREPNPDVNQYLETKTAVTSYLFEENNKSVAPMFTASTAVSAVVKLDIPVGTLFLLSPWGEGEVTITGETGVTLRFPEDELPIIASRYSWIQLKVVDINEVAVIGRLKPA